jgi:Tfp pilus assembly protein PilF
LLDKAANFYPDDPQTLDTRGVVLLRLNSLDDARQALERCLQTLDAPRAAPARTATSALAESASSQTAQRSAPAARARALLHLAQIYVRQGQQTLARPRLDEAQQLDHDHQFLNEKERAEITRLLAAAP